MAGLLTLIASFLAGLLAGLSAAAVGLALAGEALLEMAPARVQVFLVLGPLLGLLPMALLALAASRYLDVARRAPPAFGIWVVSALAATAWFGLRPLLS